MGPPLHTASQDETPDLARLGRSRRRMRRTVRAQPARVLVGARLPGHGDFDAVGSVAVIACSVAVIGRSVAVTGSTVGGIGSPDSRRISVGARCTRTQLRVRG